TLSGNACKNSSQALGGGLYAGYAPALRGTILAGNSADTGAADLYGYLTSDGHNLIRWRDGGAAPDGSSPWTATDKTGTAAAPLDPRLETDSSGNLRLKDNGGETDTLALLADSPALDAGDDTVVSAPFGLTTDQRGLPRRIGVHVDIGA